MVRVFFPVGVQDTVFGVVFKSCNSPSVGHSSLLSVRICLFSQQFTELKPQLRELGKIETSLGNHES